MTLDYARRCAEKLLAWLAPHCWKICVAGSVRRERPSPNDIDMVVIPRIFVSHDLLGAEHCRENLAVREISERCLRDHWTILKLGGDYVSFIAGKVQVDIWFATPETWGTVLLCRTGSKEHNIWLARVAQNRQGHWNPHQGLRINGHTYSETEEGIYRELGIPYIEPAKREQQFLP